jgi:hypothetical protein
MTAQAFTGIDNCNLFQFIVDSTPTMTEYNSAATPLIANRINGQQLSTRNLRQWYRDADYNITQDIVDEMRRIVRAYNLDINDVLDEY